MGEKELLVQLEIIENYWGSKGRLFCWMCLRSSRPGPQRIFKSLKLNSFEADSYLKLSPDSYLEFIPPTVDPPLELNVSEVHPGPKLSLTELEGKGSF